MMKQSGHWMNFSAQPDIFVLGALLQHGGDIAADALDVDRNGFEFKTSGFYFGQIENRVDDFQQVGAGRFHLVQPNRLLGLQATHA